MGLFSFYNVRKPRQFEHKPIYWDPHKEEMEKRVSRLKREMGIEQTPDEYRPSIKNTFIEGTSHLKKSREKGDTPRKRIYRNGTLIIVLLVLAVLYWFLYVR